MRHLSQISTTDFESIFDGRRTKREKLVWKVETTLFEDSQITHVTFRIRDVYKNYKDKWGQDFVAFYKAEKGEKNGKINIYFELL